MSERLDNEYKRTYILLEQDRERAEHLKDKLETTINMHKLKVFDLYVKELKVREPGFHLWEVVP